MKSYITDWKDVTLVELKIFLALLPYIDTISLSRLSDYWMTDPRFETPVLESTCPETDFFLFLGVYISHLSAIMLLTVYKR